MAKVITFSTKFPSYHPKMGQPTYFVEKVLKSIDPRKQINVWGRTDLTYIDSIALHGCSPKHHTIRASNRWKVGDMFSPRIWSGKPYRSKQIQFAPDIEVKKVWAVEVDINGVFSLDGKYIDVTSGGFAPNDGLSDDDLLNWFPVGKVFKGQAICWDENVKY